MNMVKLAFAVLSIIARCNGGLLGAGQGGGSCAATPFRTPAAALQWPNGCPAGNECCSEFGYCHPQSAWLAKSFRDCNGVSNGMPYPSDVIQAESAAAAQGDSRGLALLSAAGVTQSASVVGAAVSAGYGSGAAGYGSGAAGYGSGAAGYGFAGNGAVGFGFGTGAAAGYSAGAYGGGLVSFPNGAIVPDDTAEVAAARFAHLKAHSYA